MGEPSRKGYPNSNDLAYAFCQILYYCPKPQNKYSVFSVMLESSYTSPDFYKKPAKTAKKTPLKINNCVQKLSGLKKAGILDESNDHWSVGARHSSDSYGKYMSAVSMALAKRPQYPITGMGDKIHSIGPIIQKYQAQPPVDFTALVE